MILFFTRLSISLTIVTIGVVCDFLFNKTI